MKKGNNDEELGNKTSTTEDPSKTGGADKKRQQSAELDLSSQGSKKQKTDNSNVNKQEDTGVTTANLEVAPINDNNVNKLLHYAVSKIGSSQASSRELNLHNISIINSIMMLKANIYAKNNSGLIPLHAHILSSNFNGAIIKTLLWYGRNLVKVLIDVIEKLPSIVDKKNFDGDTILHFAATEKWDYSSIVLLNAKANPMIKNNNGETPFSNALLAKHFKSPIVLENLDLLQEIISQPNITNNPNFHINSRDKDGETLLHILCREKPKSYRDNKAGEILCFPKENAKFPLEKRILCLETLLKAKANPNIKNYKGKTPLEHHYYTLSSKYNSNVDIDIISKLIDFGADVNTISSVLSSPILTNTALYNFCRLSHLDEKCWLMAINIFINKKANINLRISYNHTLLDLLKTNDSASEKVIEFFISKGAKTHKELDDLEESYFSNLISETTIKCKNGTIRKVKNLTFTENDLDKLEVYAIPFQSGGIDQFDKKAKSTYGENPLSYSIKLKSAKLVEHFLSLKADPLKMKNGLFPLKRAYSKKNVSIIDAIKESVANQIEQRKEFKYDDFLSFNKCREAAHEFFFPILFREFKDKITTFLVINKFYIEKIIRLPKPLVKFVVKAIAIEEFYHKVTEKIPITSEFNQNHKAQKMTFNFMMEDLFMPADKTKAEEFFLCLVGQSNKYDYPNESFELQHEN